MNEWSFDSRVEELWLEASSFEAIYPPEEKIPVLLVPNFPALGHLAAMRFLEWVQDHPGGVVSLPTGKTPEHFIRWVEKALSTWETQETRQMLEGAGVDPARKPDMKSLTFAQVDEFYPISPEHHNSFIWYVRKYYLEAMGLESQKALLMDCDVIGLQEGQSLSGVWPDDAVDLSLRTRHPLTRLERVQRDVLLRVDDWCQRREDEIRRLGGVGFFLGGIGPDGHIGFNIRGSDHHSTTRLTETNYETQAAAAGDLGGIENSRTRLVITLGLGTLTFNPEGVAVILAAGEAKAKVVADAVQAESGVWVPASALRALPRARFYLTAGAACLLRRRQEVLLLSGETIPEEAVERAFVDLALSCRKRLLDLTEADAGRDVMSRHVLSRTQASLKDLTRRVWTRLTEKIEAGSRRLEDTRFFHVEPHHDDLMLGYLPLIVRHVRSSTNDHHFVTLTSGFTAVTNRHMMRRMESLASHLQSHAFRALHGKGYFDPDNGPCRQRDVWQYLDGIAANSREMRDIGESRRFLRDFMEVHEERDLDAIQDRMHELKHYLSTVYPGKKDPEHVQRLKGMCREWEAECLWGYFGWQASHIHHLRLGFYTGDLFNPEPTVDRDVRPILDLLEAVRPEVISMALDPEASGPDTHYKALQAVNEAVHLYAGRHEKSHLRIWGYRNVWYRFHPSEANVYVPVSLNMFSIMESAFLNTFVSQKDASFPSPEHDGPFCELAQRIQVEQYQTLKTCLGREWFAEHPSALIRGTRGFVFVKEMDLKEMGQTARRLRNVAQATQV